MITHARSPKFKIPLRRPIRVSGLLQLSRYSELTIPTRSGKSQVSSSNPLAYRLLLRRPPSKTTLLTKSSTTRKKASKIGEAPSFNITSRERMGCPLRRGRPKNLEPSATFLSWTRFRLLSTKSKRTSHQREELIPVLSVTTTSQRKRA